MAVSVAIAVAGRGAGQVDRYNFPGAERGPSLDKVDEYDYAWVSPTRFLVFAHNYQSLLPTERVLPDAPPVNPSHFRAVSVGWPNGPFSALQPFNDRFADLLHGRALGVIWARGSIHEPPADPAHPVDHKETRWSPPTLKISRDGQWMVFHQTDTKKWIAVTLSGAKMVEWPCGSTDPTEPAWTSDDRHWIECLEAVDPKTGTRSISGFRVHNVLRPRTSTEFRLKTPLRANLSTTSCLVGVTRPGNLLLQWVDPAESYEEGGITNLVREFGVKRLTVVRLAGRDLDAGPAAPQTPLAIESLVVRFPDTYEKPTQPASPLLSPDGDRMIFPRTIGLSWKGNDGNDYESKAFDLVLSDLTGSVVKVIGTMRWKPPTREYAEAHNFDFTMMSYGHPVHYRWTPDGRSLSYAINGVMYRLAIGSP